MGGMPPPKGTQSPHRAHANSNPGVRRGGSSNPCTSNLKRGERSLGEEADTPAAASRPSPILPPPLSCPKEQEGPVYRWLLLLFLLFLCSGCSLLCLFLPCYGLWLSPTARLPVHSHFLDGRRQGRGEAFGFLRQLSAVWAEKEIAQP